MFVGKLDTFVALGVRGSGMIENCSFNLGEFYVKMGKTNRNLSLSYLSKYLSQYSSDRLINSCNLSISLYIPWFDFGNST